MPRRHQRRRTKGYRLPKGVITCTRPGKWGNPFPDAETFRFYFELALNAGFNPEVWSNPAIEKVQWMAENIEQLRGKDLACWCRLDKDCHVDVLLEYANK